eukprot:CAMPEP_0176406104 /NCGR_PEP_ID=MMETSP0127-20121128/692_1 /TAXON_ID=938130 /ORGANISM="Platyophrya macrostoma, Strain WH" /LENGTH=233 /DNA_ID=CAMNT_0017785205 /DNA_START=35 /DNA_END=738 /DNA_ORIENTATION=+
MPISLFIGLGPNGRNVTEDQIRDLLSQYAPVQSIRCRGTCAFADVETEEDADKVIQGADQQYIGNARLSVQVSKQRGDQGSSRSSGPTSLFVGLGPKGRSVTEDELRSKLEEAAPVKGVRHRGECAFVDVASPADADRIMQMMRGAMLGECRLSVQLSKENRGGNDRNVAAPTAAIVVTAATAAAQTAVTAAAAPTAATAVTAVVQIAATVAAAPTAVTAATAAATVFLKCGS